MSDEESFVILGTSPTPSMYSADVGGAAESFVDKSIESTHNGKTNNDLKCQLEDATAESLRDKSIELTQKRSTNNDLECQLTNSNSSSNVSQSTVHNKCSSDLQSTSIINSGNGVSVTQDRPKVNLLQKSGSSSVGENLAASFILGEVDSTVLKSSLQSQFPSVLSSSIPEDIVEDYAKLRDAVIQNNRFLKNVWERCEKWKKEFQEMEEKKGIQIAKLRNENLELKNDIDQKVEQIRINEDFRAQEQTDLIRRISEKDSQIKNMSAQIQKLEQHQLQSYEYIPKKDEDTTYQSEAASEYVSRLEYQRVINDLNKRISELSAENTELKDKQALYIDELNCLQVNLVAAEELQKKAQNDIRALQANDVEKTESFLSVENRWKEQNEKIELLQCQLDLFRKDFKIEHEARQNLTNEKDQLISDLRELQKKNQELIKEAQKSYEEQTRQTMAPTGAFPKRRMLPDPKRISNSASTPTTYSCPLCGQIFQTLSVVQEHVNQCLDGN